VVNDDDLGGEVATEGALEGFETDVGLDVHAALGVGNALVKFLAAGLVRLGLLSERSGDLLTNFLSLVYFLVTLFNDFGIASAINPEGTGAKLSQSELNKIGSLLVGESIEDVGKSVTICAVSLNLSENGLFDLSNGDFSLKRLFFSAKSLTNSSRNRGHVDDLSTNKAAKFVTEHSLAG
jgi:hypothetical protein